MNKKTIRVVAAVIKSFDINKNKKNNIIIIIIL